MLKYTIIFAAVAGLVLALAPTAQAETYGTWPMPIVPVGNTGNTADDTGYGAVDYLYAIGTYDVTAGQYADFLNAVDPDGSNPHGLYNSTMNSSPIGCQITWNSGSNSYDFSGGTVEAPGSTADDWKDRPVQYASWYDAAMFANWATSGNINQGAYDTSVGANWGDSDASAYTGITPHNSPAMAALVATYGWVHVIPTEDEWYKAAYHMNDGDTGGTAHYYDYPTSSDTVPGYVDCVTGKHSNHPALTFVEGGADPGNYVNGDVLNSNHGFDDGPYYRTEVGEWENSASPYGTFDQGGNIFNYTEDLILPTSRGRTGGYFGTWPQDSVAGLWFTIPPAFDGYAGEGFRVGVFVPEPATLALLAFGGIGILLRRRGLRR